MTTPTHRRGINAERPTLWTRLVLTLSVFMAALLTVPPTASASSYALTNGDGSFAQVRVEGLDPVTARASVDSLSNALPGLDVPEGSSVEGSFRRIVRAESGYAVTDVVVTDHGGGFRYAEVDGGQVIESVEFSFTRVDERADLITATHRGMEGEVLSQESFESDLFLPARSGPEDEACANACWAVGVISGIAVGAIGLVFCGTGVGCAVFFLAAGAAAGAAGDSVCSHEAAAACEGRLVADHIPRVDLRCDFGGGCEVHIDIVRENDQGNYVTDLDTYVDFEGARGSTIFTTPTVHFDDSEHFSSYDIYYSEGYHFYHAHLESPFVYPAVSSRPCLNTAEGRVYVDYVGGPNPDDPTGDDLPNSGEGSEVERYPRNFALPCT